MPALDLPRLLLRGAAVVLALSWLGAAALGLWRAAGDADDEMRAAMALAGTLQHLAAEAPADDAAMLGRLRARLDAAPLRHLRLTLRDGEGRLLLGGRAEPPAAWPVEAMVGALRRVAAADDPAPLSWTLPRPDGSRWTVVLSPTPDSERREALASVAGTQALLAVGALGLLLLMRRQLHRALRPMQALLAAIEQPHARVGSLPAMPVRELQVVAEALQRAESQRMLLGQRLQSLQEDERRRLAQELHDELGQRLTALRVDAAVLQRQLPGGHAAAAQAQALAAQVEAAQEEVRRLLAQLAPRGAAAVPAQRLHEMLRSLAGAQRGLAVTLQCAPGEAPLPEALLLAVYRLSQEGLTNVVRHAGARRAWLALRREGDALHWSLRDDGRGLDDAASAFASGSGLAGMRERAWAHGGDLEAFDAAPGLGLRATLRIARDEGAR